MHLDSTMAVLLPSPLRLALVLALRLLPADVRRRHGREMAVHFATVYRAARRRGRRPAIVESLADLADIGIAGFRVRFPANLSQPPAHSKGPSSVPHDLRQAWRTLASRPAYALLTIVTLALGIGASTAVFSVVDTLLLRPLPFREPHRLVELNTRLPQEASIFHATPARFAHNWREQTAIFEGVEYYDAERMVIGDGAPEHVSNTLITPGLFALLGAAPALGRAFTEDEAHAPVDVAIISDGLWSRRFGRDPGILEKSIRLDDHPHRIVGVMPPDMQFPTNAELWTQMVPPTTPAGQSSRNMGIVARLRDGVTPRQAQADLDTIAARLASEYPYTNTDMGIVMQTANERFNGGEIRVVFLAMLGAVGFVLLIACANVANLQLSRSMHRAREIAVRVALGATRWRIVRQLLVESVTLSLAGGALGVVFAYWGSASSSTPHP
jgi:putative ABC transport system permease protein